MFSRIVAIFKLTRIEHSIMLVIAVLAAELIANRTLPSMFIILMSFITPIFISMGSFAINDYFDIDVDRLNKRIDRPLVNKSISLDSASYIAIASFAIGVIASLFISIGAFIIAFMFAVLAFLYSYKLKEMLLIGNMYIGLSMMIPFIYGSYVASYAISYPIIIISLTVFFSGIAREVHGTIRDYKGDRKRGVRSLPTYVGIYGSAIVAAISYLIAIILSIYLFFVNGLFHYNIFYIIMISIVDVILVYVSIIYMKKELRTRKLFDRSRNLSLAAMGFALIIYFLAYFV